MKLNIKIRTFQKFFFWLKKNEDYEERKNREQKRIANGLKRLREDSKKFVLVNFKLNFRTKFSTTKMTLYFPLILYAI